MSLNFELILFYATLVTGILTLADVLYFAPKRKLKSSSPSMPMLMDYSRSFFPVLLVVFLLRSFLFEPFRIPSGSLEPTLLTGDLIIVNKYDYGIRLPVVQKKIAGTATPARGDVMVFRYPAKPSVYFIKRVIGIPGDHISYIKKNLFINGKKIPQEFLETSTVIDGQGTAWQAQQKREDLLGLQHNIYINPTRPSADYNTIVPEGMYFVMGDNRDDSQDSRYWGFVPDKNVVGKAVMIWMSWDSNDHKVRWNRIFKMVH